MCCAHKQVFSRQGLWIGILFGPPGACLRWWLGKHLNGAVDNFFLGTWVANMLASVLDTIIAAIALRENVSGTTWMLVFSFSNGFNGSLSTVSTWLNEVCAWSLSCCIQRSVADDTAVF